MKKHLVMALAAALFGIPAITAQMQTIKDAERAVKEGKTPAEVMTIITPAFTNPETANLAQTYYVPGKAMFAQYDELFALKSFNKLPEGGDRTMANNLVTGYDLFIKALPLDTVVNEKGKVKTKYSKDIINTVSGHFSDFNSAALAFWENKDYNGAYRAWDIFLGLIDDARFGIKNAPADTIVGEVYFNQALAAWQADSLKNALTSFAKAKSHGYTKKALYDYAIAVASNLKDEDAVYQYALEAQPMYGAEDPNYFGFIINHYLQSNQIDQAMSIVDEAIANNPENAQYHVVKGVLFDNQGKKDDAKASFLKATELDPYNSLALFQYGRALCEEAYTLSDNAPTNPAESEKYFNEKIVPLFKQAAEYMENAWNIDNNNTEALRYLENVYYNLHDEAKLNDVKSRMAN